MLTSVSSKFLLFSFFPPNSHLVINRSLGFQSLFGMNVNVLRDNPDWKWSLLVAALSGFLTMGVWIVLKVPRVSFIVVWSDIIRADQSIL